jgi:hypothetical protein
MAKRDTVLRSEAALHEYCNSLRKTSGQEFKYLMDAASELRAALGGSSRVKAWIVSWHLVLAAHACKAASAHSVATYASFLKWFEPELTTARSKTKKGPKAKAQQSMQGQGFEFGGN